MEDPKLFSGPSLTRLAQGAAGGAALAMIVGFGFGGWYTGTGAKTFAAKTASEAVTAALTPICAASFAANATPAQQADLKTMRSYDRPDLLKRVVKVPGVETLDYTLVGSCAEAILAAGTKSAQVK